MPDPDRRDQPDEPLTGGNMAEVSRRGDEVLRTAGPWTPTIHRLLDHLRARGVEGVAEPRGLDPSGRERLEFLPGVVPAYPMPGWVWHDDIVAQTSSRLRRIHDASLDFDRTGAIWQLPGSTPDEVICHNDFAPYNLVFDEQHRLTSVIDWDVASPGSRGWDLAYLAYRLVPLTDPGNPDVAQVGPVERRRRLDLLLSSYGTPLSRQELCRIATQRISGLLAFTSARVDPAVNSLAGHVEIYRADLSWLRTEAGTLG